MIKYQSEGIRKGEPVQHRESRIPCACGCGERITPRSKWGDPRRYLMGHNLRLMPRTGKDNAYWKGGRKIHDRYIQILIAKQKYVLEHRYVWEQHNHACLLPWGVAHHKNGNKQDNRIENLEGMTMRQHTIAHNTIDTSNRKCLDCGSTKTYVNTRGCRVWNRFSTGYICVNCYNIRWRKARK